MLWAVFALACLTCVNAQDKVDNDRCYVEVGKDYKFNDIESKRLGSIGECCEV